MQLESVLEGQFRRKTCEFASSFTLEKDSTLNFMVSQLDSYIPLFLNNNKKHQREPPWCFVPLKYAYLALFEKKQPMGKILKVFSLKFFRDQRKFTPRVVSFSAPGPGR